MIEFSIRDRSIHLAHTMRPELTCNSQTGNVFMEVRW